MKTEVLKDPHIPDPQISFQGRGSANYSQSGSSDSGGSAIISELNQIITHQFGKNSKGKTMSSVVITEKAAGEMRRVMDEQKMGEEFVLRVGVAGGGCSGFQYSLGFDNRTDQAKDEITEQRRINRFREILAGQVFQKKR